MASKKSQKSKGPGGEKKKSSSSSTSAAKQSFKKKKIASSLKSKNRNLQETLDLQTNAIYEAYGVKDIASTHGVDTTTTQPTHTDISASLYALTTTLRNL